MDRPDDELSGVPEPDPGAPGAHHHATGMGSGDDGRPVGIRAALALAGLMFLWWRFGLLTVLVVAALVVAVFLHELGHYVTARWSGMKATEFFLGFGPRIWSFRRGETTYGIKALPLGAYVRIIGMTKAEEVDPRDEPRTYRQQAYPKRVLVASAGSLMHFLMAFVLLVVLFAGYGRQQADVWSVRALSGPAEGVIGAAELAGIQPGDRIVGIDGETLAAWDDLANRIRAAADTELTLTVIRDGETLALTATPSPYVDPRTGDEVGLLGVSPRFPLVPDRSPGVALRAADTVVDGGWASIKALGTFFSPSNLMDYTDRLFNGTETATGPDGEPVPDDNRLLSPVGFGRIASQAAEAGMPEVLQLLILINIFIGVFNLAPLLPFDGGHIVVATYERLRSRRGRRYYADAEKLIPLTIGVLAVLGFMATSALWLDVTNPLANPFE